MGKRFKRTYTLEEFAKEVLYLIHEKNGHGIHSLFDKNYIGSCPCAEGILNIEGVEYRIITHCWRQERGCCTLEVQARKNKNKDKVVSLLLKALNKTDWYGEYELVKLSDKENE